MRLVRKVVTVTEDVVTELGSPVAHHTRRVAAAAVIANPWAGRGVVSDLTATAADIAPDLAVKLSSQLTSVLGGADEVQAFGKAALVGLDGEIEHGAALIHTPYFGNLLRELVEGSSIVVFSDDRAAAGSAITVPIWHKRHAATRSHYQTIQVRIPDAPADDEIVVIAAAASGPRPNARIGDRTTDPNVTLAELENES
jgi:hypothetical protein